MSTLREAAQQAQADPTDPGYEVEVLREHVRHLERRVRELHALAQQEQEQEPVAHSVQSPDDAKRNRITPSLVTDTRQELEEYLGNSEAAKHIVPIYIHPPRREWVSLTEEEIGDVFHAARNAKLGSANDNSRHRLSVVEIARAVEAALKERNT